MDRRAGSLMPGAVGLAGALALLAAALGLDVDLQRNVGGAIGPAHYPLLLAGVGIAVALIVLIEDRHGSVGEDGTAEAVAEGDARARLRLAGTMALLLAYALLLEPVGYLVLTPPLLVAFMALAGERRPFRMLAAALVLTGALWAFFRFGVSLVLPEGLLGERLG